MQNERPLIIKRVKKGGGHGHHGGAWKVAYADFVTAMMAFFLLLWLLNVTTDVQKRGIADYFSPAALSQSTSGSGGMLGGLTIIDKGSRISANGVPSVVIGQAPPDARRGRKSLDVGASPRETNGGPKPPGDEGAKLTAKNLNPAARDQAARNGTAGTGKVRVETKAVAEAKAELAKEETRKEQAAFEKAQQELRQAIDDSPELKALKDSLLVDMTPQGLRIQIVDQKNQSMFPTGSAQMTPRTRLLLQKIAGVIAKLPNKISISGHTDAAPYPTDATYDNWELSSDRANASRRVLIESGLPPERISQVVGRADEDPLIKANPLDPRNRRISIVLLRMAPPPVPASAPASAPANTPAAGAAGAKAAPAQPQQAPAPAAAQVPARPPAEAPVLPPDQR